MSHKPTLIAAALLCLGAFLGASARPAAAAGTAAVDIPLCPGVWTYFSDPRAITHGDTSFVGCISNDGKVVVTSYDTRTGVTKTVTLRKHFGADDHNNPSIVDRKDGRLIAFYSPHSGRFLPPPPQKQAMYYRISKRPYDISAWSKTYRVPLKKRCGLGFTYSNPIRLRGGHIFLAFRGACWHPTFTILNAHTNRWSKPLEIVAHNKYRQYAKYAYDGHGGVDIAYTKSHPHSTPSNVYYMKYRNGRFYHANGKLIGTVRDLPFRVTQGDLAYNRAVHGSGWVQDVATGFDGRPRIVLQAGTTQQTVTYRYARWTGDHWADTFVAAANLWKGALVQNGETFVAGGITLSHRNPRMVYLSRAVNNRHVIQLGYFAGDAKVTPTPDSNPLWQFDTIATMPQGSCFRPVESRGFSGPLVVYFFCGKHTGWQPGRFQTEVFGKVIQPAR